MIPAIKSIFGKAVQWWQGQLSKLVQSVPKESPEAVVDPQIRQWFYVWLANQREVDVSLIKDRGRLSAVEVLAAMTAFKSRFGREMSSDRFNGHWGAISVHVFLEHAQHCYHYRRPSRTDRRPA